MAINYLGASQIYTGGTSDYTFESPVDVIKGQTLIIFITAADIGLSPTKPSDWTEIQRIESGNGTLYGYWHQATGDTIRPTWTITGLSNKFNAGFCIFLDNCSKNPNKIINNSDARVDISFGPVPLPFSTTVKNTAIIQCVSIVGNPSVYVVSNSWSSDPTLIWTESRKGLKQSGVYSIYHSSAISLPVPTDDYETSYVLNQLSQNLVINVAVSPLKTNQVQNLIRSF